VFKKLNKILQHVLNGIWLNPIWITEYKLKTSVQSAIELAKIAKNQNWLDVGCGLRPYESCFPTGSYVGVDIEQSGRSIGMKLPDYFYDGQVFPFADSSFDGVISTQVLEHVPNARSILTEMNRVINHGGLLIISLPFVWPEHEEPYDFCRFTSFGITELLKSSGFEIESIVKDTGAVEVMAVTLNVYIMSNLVPPIRGLGRIVALTICFPIQLMAIILQKILPDSGQLYLNMVVSAKKIAPCSQ
tara:strand:+ start:1829 stop:2563 length:735 start_codon:yes stop_codon:yes gene_type:complete